MKKLKIGVLGATGAVGQEMLKILEEYDIPVAELRPLASARSAGSLIRFRGQDVAIQAASDEGLSVRKISRHVFNACNSFFNTISYEEVHHAAET